MKYKTLKFMNNIQKKTILILIFFLLSLSSIYAQKAKIPDLENRVTDLSNKLSSQENVFLENSLSRIEKETGSQIAILLVHSTGSESIETFSMRVAEKWKIGSEERNDGIIMIVAMQDRKIRIEVGYGLESTIPDAIAKRIIDEKIIPEFKESNYYNGINLAVIQFEYLLKGQPSIADTKSKKSKRGILNYFIISTIISVIFALIIISLAFIKNKKTRKTFIIITVIVSILCSIGLFFAFLSVLGPIIKMILIICGIIFLVAITGKFMGGHSSGSGSSSCFSSGGSSNSGSSFSGGGGSFGGGGASGSW